MIIVEGPDSSGKTTLAKELASQFGLNYLKSPGPKTDYDWWMSVLTLPTDQLAKLICDRFLFSEFVYGPIVRGKIKLSPLEIDLVISMLVTAEPLVVHCELHYNREYFDCRPQLLDWDTNLRAAAAYTHVLRGWNHKVYKWNDWNSHAATCKAVDSYCNQSVVDWQARRKELSYGRGQLCSPQLMIVGESFSTNNQWKVPFERSRSAQMLHEGLRKAGFTMWDVWFTNVLKTGKGLTSADMTTLKREIELLNPTEILSLGNHASGWVLLTNPPMPVRKLIHPGWWVRRSQIAEGYDYYSENLARIMEGLK